MVPNTEYQLNTEMTHTEAPANGCVANIPQDLESTVIAGGVAVTTISLLVLLVREIRLIIEAATDD